jgi:aspartate racemase
MGPLAGVQLQKLIIEATPAAVDQDHMQVVCFTNPKVPDRTTSLERNGGREYLSALSESLRVLEATNVDAVIIPCNTAHARMDQLRCWHPNINFIHIVETALEMLLENNIGHKPRVLLFATNGTLASRIYEDARTAVGVLWQYPTLETQQRVMELIYKTKSVGVTSETENQFRALMHEAVKTDTDYVVLGCTELSLFTHLQPEFLVRCVDPLKAAACKVVRMSKE